MKQVAMLFIMVFEFLPFSLVTITFMLYTTGLWLLISYKRIRNSRFGMSLKSC